jgi:poly(glycerol-phosphate) alpha-glucosyltransferase
MNVAVLSLISRRAGGLFYSVRWLSKALAVQGCVPRVFSARDQFSDEDLPLWDPLEVTLYKSFGPLQSSAELRPMLAASNAELVHVHGIWLDRQWVALQWQKRTGNPVVISPRGMLDSWAVNNSAWKKKLVGALFANESLRKATCLHALCPSEVESIRAYGLKTPIALIPNGVELPDLNPSGSKLGPPHSIPPAPPAGKLLQRNGSEASNFNPQASHSKKCLLFLGRIHPKKGLVELIQAWAKAGRDTPRARPEWQLVIAGWDDGGHLESLKQQATDLEVIWAEASSARSVASNTILQTAELLFLGPQYGEQKDALLRRADAFVLPSFSEGLPMSVLEAWSYGLPVLMTEFCNIQEGFEAGASLRIDPNTDSITRGLLQLADMPDEDLETMGSHGRLLVEQQFTWPKIAKDMKAVYEWCLGGGSAPSCLIED